MTYLVCVAHRRRRWLYGDVLRLLPKEDRALVLQRGHQIFESGVRILEASVAVFESGIQLDERGVVACQTSDFLATISSGGHTYTAFEWVCQAQ